MLVKNILEKRSKCPFNIDECRFDWEKKLVYIEWLKAERLKDREEFVRGVRSAYYCKWYRKKKLEATKNGER